MAAFPMTCVRLTTSMNTNQMAGKISTPKLVHVGRATTDFPCLRTSRFQTSCLKDTSISDASDAIEKRAKEIGANTTDVIEKLDEKKDTVTSTANEDIKKVVESTNTNAKDLAEKLIEKKEEVEANTSDAIKGFVEKASKAATDFTEEK
ncbi:unnamed protein product [Lactuca saligna]|uniref:Uncharacterized protein n=1 Tax=Lactuca saligna TaxID=75948 RepID=A0AA36E394_LACSI|nr:unnamed protein product [Lactuca saligna]